MKRLFVVLLLATAVLSGCESGSEATVEYTGITRTDDKGGVISRDENDWKNVPLGCTGNCFTSNILAYPNPTKSTFTLAVTIVSNAVIVDRVFVYDNRNFVVASLSRTFEKKGDHRGVIDLSGLASGIYRVKFYVTNIDTQASYVVYGDVEKQ
jgi:hypothetical protein